jgi:hypothetical protein
MRGVSELAELLELLHGADAQFETLYGRFRTWHHHERSHAAFEAEAERQRGRGAFFGSFGAAEMPAESEEVVSVWRQEPDRARTERPDSYAVAVGERWWMWQADVGAMSNEDDDSVSSGVGDEFDVLLSPAQLLGLLRFEPAGSAERAGRAVIVANARPRAESRHGRDGFALHELGFGADCYRLEIDAERGLILASQAFVDDAPFSEVTALELRLDEPIDPALFEFAPPKGEVVRPPLQIQSRNVSIAEAQAAAPFTVLIPERVPSSWHVRCTYVEGSHRPEAQPSVHLHYHSDSAHEDLNISQGSVTDLGPEIDEEEFEKARAGKRTVWVRRRDERWPQAQLFTEHEGTRIQMTSQSLTAEQLITLAAILVPAPDTPSEL